MYVYIRAYIYAYINTYIYIRVYIYIFIYIWMLVCVYACIYTLYMCVEMSVHVHCTFIPNIKQCYFPRTGLNMDRPLFSGYLDFSSHRLFSPVS